MQQGDVRLFQTNDNGDILVENGLVEMDGGLETAVYLSLFGGNFDDSGAQDSPQWWGGIDENMGYRSETQYLLHSLVAIPSNLLLLSDAVKRDLAWMITDNVVTSISVEVGMPAVKRVNIIILINGDDTVEFTENWGAL